MSKPLLKVELHCHSDYSRDSDLKLKDIVTACLKRGIGAVALTDHNEIRGAFKLQEIAPANLKVIIGEEIRTDSGDVIGLFLTERIAPDQPIQTVIEQIKDQGGIVLLPHPFDRIRREAVGPYTTDLVKNQIDFIEVFNARTLRQKDNQRALLYAKQENLAGFVGSDAHTFAEYGRAVNIIEDFTDAVSFKTALSTAKFVVKGSGWWPHARTFITKLKKRRQQT